MAYEFMRLLAGAPLQLSAAERQAARDALGRTASFVHRQYEPAGYDYARPRRATAAHGAWRMLHLHDPSGDELVTVEHTRSLAGRVTRAAVELAVLGPLGVEARHMYGFSLFDKPPSRTVMRIDIPDALQGITPEAEPRLATGAVDTTELAGLYRYLEQKISGGLYTPVGIDQALRPKNPSKISNNK